MERKIGPSPYIAEPQHIAYAINRLYRARNFWLEIAELSIKVGLPELFQISTEQCIYIHSQVHEILVGISAGQIELKSTEKAKEAKPVAT